MKHLAKSITIRSAFTLLAMVLMIAWLVFRLIKAIGDLFTGWLEIATRASVKAAGYKVEEQPA